MPRSRDSRYFVLNQLQELSEEADRFADQMPEISDLNEYFSLVKEIAYKIGSCTSKIKGIELPPDIKSFLNKGNPEIKSKFIEIEETQKEHIHAEKKVNTGSKTTENHDKNSMLKTNILSSQKIETENITSSVDSFAKKNQASSLLPQTTFASPIRTPKTVKKFSTKNILENNNCISEKLLKTPILNRTFSKLTNDSVLLDSTSHVKDKTLKVVSSGVKESLIHLKSEADSSGPQTRSGSRKKIKVQAGNECIQTQSGSKKKSPENETNGKRMQNRSGPKKKSPKDEIDGSSAQIRSGKKRKSSPSKQESSKKLKKELINKIVSNSDAKISQSKYVLKNNALKPLNSLPSNNMSKVSAVIVPTMKQYTPTTVLKERQLLEEIQKKDQKASEAQKRLLAERQQKAEEQKKKREEKMEKTLQKRLLMEKEKEEKKERLEKKEIEKKLQQAKLSKETAKKPILKKDKEQNEEQVRENSSKVLATCEQTEANVTVVKTPGKKQSDESETYDLTPAPDSSTYDYSDDDDKPSGKPIPMWAQGVLLKSALIQQFYNPPNTDEIFGSYIESPDLVSLFQIKKKKYFKRTSSAVWNSPPGLSRGIKN